MSEKRKKYINNKYATDTDFRKKKKEYYEKNKTRIAKRRKEIYEEKKKEYQKYWASPKGKYIVYKSSAKKRGLQFLLTLDTFKQILKQPCFYCNDAFDSIGIDRVDNKIGYIDDNIVSCCYSCNLMKRAMSQDSFIRQCSKIHTNFIR